MAPHVGVQECPDPERISKGMLISGVHQGDAWGDVQDLFMVTFLECAIFIVLVYHTTDITHNAITRRLSTPTHRSFTPNRPGL